MSTSQATPWRAACGCGAASLNCKAALRGFMLASRTACKRWGSESSTRGALGACQR